MSFFKSRSGLILGLAFALATGCGKGQKQLAEQPQDEISMPSAPEAEFSLTGNQKINFVGYLVLWDATVPAAGMADVLSAVFDDRAAKVADLQHFQDELRWAQVERDSARKDLDRFQRHLQKIYGGSDQLRQARTELGSQWYNQRLQALVNEGVIDETDTFKSKENFYAYCEAKVWELAVSGLGQKTLQRRPSPHLFCEEYYRGIRLFEHAADGQSCRPHSEGQSYFDCLWYHGVMRTRSFRDLYDDACKRSNPTPKVATLKTWIETGILQKVLRDPDLGRQLASAIMSRGRIPFPVSRAYPELSDCSSAFKLARELRGNLEWWYASATELRNNVEAKRLESRRFPLIPATGDVNQDDAQWEMLARGITLAGERPNDGTSLSDYWLIFSDDLPAPRPEDREAAKARADLADFFAGFEALIPESSRKNRDAKAAAAGAKEQNLVAAKNQQNSLREAIGAAQERGALAAADPGTAYGFAKINLQLELEGGTVGNVTAGALGDELGFEVSDFNAENGVLGLRLRNPASLFGLQPRPRTEGDPYFLDNNIALPGEITGKLSLRLVEGMMWALTGEMQLLTTGGDPLIFGALTVDNYSEARTWQEPSQ